MADDPTTSEPFSLKRWSQRKRAAARTEPVEPLLPSASDLPSPAVAAIPNADATPPTIPETPPLPPVDSLTFDSDFSAFMQPKIDEETKRAALKKLFSDPSFNVMDGLDIYVGDYTQSDPMPAGMLDRLSAVYAMLDPVKPPPDEATAAVGLPTVAEAAQAEWAELPAEAAVQVPLATPTSGSSNTEIETGPETQPEPDTGTA